MTDEREGFVLIADDDIDVARFIERNLTLEGFEAAVVHDGRDALDAIERRRPDLVVLDVMMPGIDGIELCRQLRADPLTATLPVIMLTARSFAADKVLALAAGADDYVVKPFDTLELVARVRSTLRRNREIRDVSPLTGLPGNARILAEIAQRVTGSAEYAVCYADLDNFKTVNDVYGFVRGDQMIVALAAALHSAARAAGVPRPFIGHIGGDDFVAVCTPAQVGPITERMIVRFADESAALYDVGDLERGGFEVADRQGNVHRRGLLTLSIGVALSTQRAFTDHREVVAVATEMKQVAKRSPGSVVAVDRRRDREPGRGRIARTQQWPTQASHAEATAAVPGRRRAGAQAPEPPGGEAITQRDDEDARARHQEPRGDGREGAHVAGRRAARRAAEAHAAERLRRTWDE